MRIAVFADGTWNKMDLADKGTNVVKLYSAALHDPHQGQVTFYDEGVGNKWYNRIRGGAFGIGISENIKQSYDFIMQNWTANTDEIFLFGFSRGAYTIRSLAGMISFIGILRTVGDDKERAKLIEEAYSFYRDARAIAPKTEEERKKQNPTRKARYDAFRQKHVRDLEQRTRIKMVGVWDTVGALGIPQNWLNEKLNPFPHKFHDTSLSGIVDKAYHAVSIDEKRKAFEPTLWDPDPRVVQLYFAGVHSDVGGGYKDDSQLGDITLAWMAHHAKRQGLQLNWERLPKLGGTEYRGLQHESWTAQWRLVRRFDRDITAGTSICRSVRLRAEEANKESFKPYPYAPPRLIRPLENFTWANSGWPKLDD